MISAASGCSSAPSNRMSRSARNSSNTPNTRGCRSQKETELFFDNLMRQDRPVTDFLNAKYTFLNERLAEFYGIPGVKGAEFRKVDLTGTNREGVLTQASVLTVSSYANRTSPVIRGKWVLENILNAPPPPPPPDVPTLDESAVGTTARCASSWKSTGPTRSVRRAIRAWTRLDSRWRISMPSGNGAPKTANSRSMPRAASRWPQVRGVRGTGGCADVRPECVREGHDREDADVCPGPGSRIV